jgi:transposase
MRQTHVAGDKLFVDFAGRTMPVTLSPTGEIRAAQVFVAVLGASNYTYAEAVWSQTVPDWVGAHVRAFQFFGGATRLVVPDNLKSAVIKACYFEPQVQRTYGDMLRHYGSAALPARPLKPRDKAKVEVGVQIVQRWILARLRNRIFISLPQLNAAILELVGELNNRLMRHLGVSRRQLFDQIEAGALKKLPDQYYVYADWQRGRVGLDYHVRVDQHAYSVPSGLIGEEVDARISAATVEIFHRSKRVAVHLRTTGPGATTAIEHMPASHRRYKEWSVERIQREAAAIGSSTATLIGAILNDKPHPELGFRAALGILRLAISHGQDRLEAACVRALAIGARSYTSVASILTKHLERHPDPIRETEATIDHHANVRGSHYYH